MDIENRKYGPDSSEEELKTLRERVEILEEGILLFREVPVPSPFTIEYLISWADQLAAEWDSYTIVIDLTEASRPSAEERDSIRRVIGSLSRMNHLAIMTGGNILLNVAVRFIMSGIEGTKVTVHGTMEEALREAGCGEE